MKDIQQAALDDFAAIRGLFSLLRTGVKDFYWDSDKYIRAAIQEKRCFAVKDGHVVKAALIIEERTTETNYPHKCLAIGAISVRPACKKEGAGTDLVEFAKKTAFESRKRLYVESFFEYKRLSFYKKLGFKEGRPKDYQGKPYHVMFLDPLNIPDFPKMKRINIRNKLEYLSYLKKMPLVPSDVTFENLFVFDGPFRQVFLSLLNNNLVVLTKRGEKVYFYPIIGTSRPNQTVFECLDWLVQEKREGGFICAPYFLPDSLSPGLRARLKIVRDRDNFDYLYDAKALSSFDGPKLRTQKQNLAGFLKKNPEYRVIGPAMVKEAIRFQDDWINDYQDKMKRNKAPVPETIINEDKAIKKALAHYKCLNLSLGGVYLDQDLQGFYVLGFFNQTAYSHFEKAARKKGAYQALLQFVGQTALQKGAKIVNREQDLGVPGLRTSKKRYNPAGFIEKCRISLR